MRQSHATWATAIVILLASSAAYPAPWTLRGHGISSDYTHRSTDSSIGGTAFLELAAESGVGLALERRMGPLLGWEVSAGEIDLDTTVGFIQYVPVSFDPFVLEERVTFSPVDPIALRPVTAALLLHGQAGRLDLYGGPLAGVSFFDVGNGLPDRDPELTYGGKVGADVRLGQSAWGVNFEFRHLQILHDTVDRDLYGDMGVQTLGFGISYGFPHPRRTASGGPLPDPSL